MPRHIEFSCIFRQGSRIGRAHHPHNEECFEAAGVRDTFISVERRTAVSVLRDKARAGRPWQHKAVMAQGRARRSEQQPRSAAPRSAAFPGPGAAGARGGGSSPCHRAQAGGTRRCAGAEPGPRLFPALAGAGARAVRCGAAAPARLRNARAHRPPPPLQHKLQHSQRACASPGRRPGIAIYSK